MWMALFNDGYTRFTPPEERPATHLLNAADLLYPATPRYSLRYGAATRTLFQEIVVGTPHQQYRDDFLAAMNAPFGPKLVLVHGGREVGPGVETSERSSNRFTGTTYETCPLAIMTSSPLWQDKGTPMDFGRVTTTLLCGLVRIHACYAAPGGPLCFLGLSGGSKTAR